MSGRLAAISGKGFMQLGAQNEGCSAREERQRNDDDRRRRGRMHVADSVAGTATRKAKGKPTRKVIRERIGRKTFRRRT
jgi:hypothetical protein